MSDIKLANWMTVKDYSVKKGITVDAVYKAIKRGKLPSRKLGTFTLVYDDDE